MPGWSKVSWRMRAELIQKPATKSEGLPIGGIALILPPTATNMLSGAAPVSSSTGREMSGAPTLYAKLS